MRKTEGDDAARGGSRAWWPTSAQAYEDNIAIRDAIASGEIDVGLINHYYVVEALAEEAPTTRSASTSRPATSARW